VDYDISALKFLTRDLKLENFTILMLPVDYNISALKFLARDFKLENFTTLMLPVDYDISALKLLARDLKLENLTIKKYHNLLAAEDESVSPMTNMSKIFLSC